VGCCAQSGPAKAAAQIKALEDLLGPQLRKAKTNGDNLQDDGIHFQVLLTFF
jgi:hypothetical protein